MSNVSIYENNWIDLVFEGKNKAYGAYQLRQENSRTSLLAFLGGITFFCGTIGLGLFLTSFNDVSAPTLPDNDIVIKVDNINLPPQKNNEPKKKALPVVKSEPKEQVKSKDLTNAKIVETSQATDVITQNKDLDKPKTDNPNPNGGDTQGVLITTNTGGNDGEGKGGEGKKDDGPLSTNLLDKLPEYPGGISKFYEYVSRNFDRPDIDEDGNITMSVIVSFVVEKDGSLTDIKALRSTDVRMEKEAIRVLRASRTKWSPGIKDGKPVRTQYTLPIRVKV